MAEFNLQEVLDECRKSARIGYDLASSQYKRLRDTIASAESKIEDTLIAFNSSTCYLSDATASLSQQLSETRSAIDQLSFESFRLPPFFLESNNCTKGKQRN